MKTASRLTFEVPATPAAVDALCAQAEAWLIEGGLGSERFPVAMLLRESLNNSMLHGCGNDPDRFIRCEIRRGRTWLHIMVADDGPGFDWSLRLECRAGVTECHGRGLQIYQLYSDAVEFNRRGNCVRLRRRIPGRMLMTTVQVQKTDATVTVEGALTVAQAQELRPQLQKAIAAGVSSVVFDLGGSDVVDSSGIGLLIATHNSLKGKGGRLKVINVSPEIMNLFKTMRLDRHFTVEGRRV